ncbi:MAG: type II toxin-antitoxin system VapC family toxin [Peptococcaceae bacterium]|jgi:predicted nucleic acid-binding protein|nr:type II toxin-antitoxin system VapC family toxin [Peptococcaceae bacterium]
MSGVVCIDANVFIKLLTLEELSSTASRLVERVVENNQTIVLPGFAWAEVGSVLRQKVERKIISSQEADEAWKAFRGLKVISFLEGEEIADLTWSIACDEKLPTLYDAAYLAVAETAVARYAVGGLCEFWTADERLVNHLGGHRAYVRLLRDFGGAAVP